MYAPNNICVYLKAYTGCLSGLGADGKQLLDPTISDETNYALMADAYAQQFDTTWGGASVTGYEEDAIEENSEAIWAGRSPLENSIASIPANYSGLVNGVIALVKAGLNQLTAEGINPNGCAPGSGPSQNILAFFGPWGATNVHADSPVALTAAAPVRAFNTTGGAIQYLTPPLASLFDGMVIGIKPAVASATPATLHAQNGGGETVEDPSNSGNFGADGTVPGQGPACFWKYRVSDKKWIGFIGV
jgi:hypothetical protein